MEQTTQHVAVPNVTSYTEYSYPIATESGEIVAQKSDLDNAPAFVRIDPTTGEESRIAHIGVLSSRPSLRLDRTTMVDGVSP